MSEQKKAETGQPETPLLAPLASSPILVDKGSVSVQQIAEIEKGQFHTVQEVAKRLNYSYIWILYLVQGGRIKAIKPLGGRWRIPASELDRLLKEGLPMITREKPKMEATTIVLDEEQSRRINPPPKEEPARKPAPWKFPIDFGPLFGGQK